MDFHDFPGFWGNLGVETDHPPKMCASLLGADFARGLDEGVQEHLALLVHQTHARQDGPHQHSFCKHLRTLRQTHSRQPQVDLRKTSTLSSKIRHKKHTRPETGALSKFCGLRTRRWRGRPFHSPVPRPLLGLSPPATPGRGRRGAWRSSRRPCANSATPPRAERASGAFGRFAECLKEGRVQCVRRGVSS